jgi:hypothetical protein
MFLFLQHQETLSVKDAHGGTQIVGDVEESVINIVTNIEEETVLVTCLVEETCLILGLAIFFACLLWNS